MILNEMASKLCIAKDKVFATGFSNGAMMAYEIALRKSDVFAAVAPVEGSVHVSYFKTIEATNTTQPISILEIHGVDDTTIPSNSTISDDYWKYEKT